MKGAPIHQGDLQENEIYVGRGTSTLKASLWANPFSVRRYGRPAAIQQFEKYLGRSTLLTQLPLLRGKVLRCHCPAHLPCHVDSIISAFDDYVTGMPKAKRRRVDSAAAARENTVEENKMVRPPAMKPRGKPGTPRAKLKVSWTPETTKKVGTHMLEAASSVGKETRAQECLDAVPVNPVLPPSAVQGEGKSADEDIEKKAAQEKIEAVGSRSRAFATALSQFATGQQSSAGAETART